MVGFIESTETARRALGLPTASMTDRRARLLEILLRHRQSARPDADSTARLISRCAIAPAAQGSSARLLRGDSSRCDQSQSHEMRAWRAARWLAMTIYRLTEASDFEQDSELRRQMRRASAAMMSDVAELYEAPSRVDSHRSLRNARSSVIRLQTHLAIAAGRDYIQPQTLEQLNDSAQELKEAIAEYLKGGGAGSENKEPGARSR